MNELKTRSFDATLRSVYQLSLTVLSMLCFLQPCNKAQPGGILQESCRNRAYECSTSMLSMLCFLQPCNKAYCKKAAGTLL